MKTHAIIPIFIPHEGCPHDCIFCNQNAITARNAAPSYADVYATVDQWLTTIIPNEHIRTREIAFYGGSFTGIPMAQQSGYLSIAKEYKDKGLIHKIHLSTRPDYINIDILNNLKHYGVDIIELGVQSFDDTVLRLSNRGHSSAIVYDSAKMIKEYGFELGIQLMIGLPGDTYDKCMYSAREAVKIAPSLARLYPTVVLHDTGLYELSKRGLYKPLSSAEAVETTKEMYKILSNAGITILRVGLKSTDYIKTSGGAPAGDYHPAFRQLVESEIARDIMKEQLNKLLSDNASINSVCFTCDPVNYSNMTGHKRSNKLYFSDNYPHIRFRYAVGAIADKNSIVCTCDDQTRA